MMSFLDKLKTVDTDSALKLVCLASSRANNEVYVFMSPTYERSRVLAREFETLIESIPEWARTKITVKRATEFQFENNVKVKFINSPIHVKGLTMNSLFIAGDWKREDIEYVAPCLAYGTIMMRIK